MQNPDSLFTQLVQQTGPSTARTLKHIAKVARTRADGLVSSPTGHTVFDTVIYEGEASRHGPPLQSHHRRVSLASSPYIQGSLLPGVLSFDGDKSVSSVDTGRHSRHSRLIRHRRTYAHAHERSMLGGYVGTFTMDEGVGSCRGFSQSAAEALSWRSLASVAPSTECATSADAFE